MIHTAVVVLSDSCYTHSACQTKLANHLVEEVNRLKMETPLGTQSRTTDHGKEAGAQEEWMKNNFASSQVTTQPNHPTTQPPTECT